MNIINLPDLVTGLFYLFVAFVANELLKLGKQWFKENKMKEQAKREQFQEILLFVILIMFLVLEYWSRKPSIPFYSKLTVI